MGSRRQNQKEQKKNKCQILKKTAGGVLLAVAGLVYCASYGSPGDTAVMSVITGEADTSENIEESVGKNAETVGNTEDTVGNITDTVGNTEETIGKTVETVGNTDMVNINRASLAELCSLSGIGPAKAQKIIDYRTEHGLFSCIEDIMKVPGIKSGIYGKIKDKITV